jgi:hypothetical protein
MSAKQPAERPNLAPKLASKLALGLAPGIGLIGAVGMALSATLLVSVPTGTAHAATAAVPSCAAAWSASAIYVGGDTASYDSVNYLANWWTQGQNPASNNGGAGSGQPWTSQGACGSGSSGGGSSSSSSSSSSGGGSNSSSSSSSGGGGSSGALLFSPYKDITINFNWNTNVMQTAVTGTTIPLVGSGSLVSTQEPNLGGVTLAFATGECGSENWGGVSRTGFASANIQALSGAGLNYVVSTGGQAGVFTCSTQAGMQSFISTYLSSQMVGVDYDIEGGQTAADIDNLVAQTAWAETQYPNLRFSFTLATLAASDGSYGGLNTLGDSVVKAIQAAHLPRYTINLMVMDYGTTSAANCVVVNGTCEMGQSAIQAVQNLEHTYGIPASQIELTPMIGVNDSSSEIVSLTDVDTITGYALAQGLVGLHFWSLDRDTPCPSPSSTALATCNSVTGSTPLQYTNRFLSDLGR